MANLQWSRSDEAWIAKHDSEHFEDFEIRVLTDDESVKPSACQLKSVEDAEYFASSGLPPTKKLAREYAAEYLGSDEVDEMDDEELEIEVQTAIIPRLRESVNTYVVFVGNSDIDIEHGVAIICKNRRVCAVAHSDLAYTPYEWDDTTELDQLCGG